MFTRKEDDDTLIRHIAYIDDCLYFSASDTAREKFQTQLVDRFNMELQGLSHCYLSAIIHQKKDFNITMDHSRYIKSTVTIFLEAAGIKKSNTYFQEEPTVHLVQYTVNTRSYYTHLLNIVREQYYIVTNNNEEHFHIKWEPTTLNGNPKWGARKKSRRG
jgi:hypothetical protein